jgi:hypothetical protein
LAGAISGRANLCRSRTEALGKTRLLSPWSSAMRPPSSWAGSIDQVLIEGDVLTEIDFFHRPSRTLILTDLIENFEAGRIRNRWYR